MKVKDIVEPVVDTVENGLELVYNDVAHPTLSIIGKTLGTVVEFACMFALPLDHLNNKVKKNFQYRLEQYAEKLKTVPENQRVEVHTQIGVPIIQHLSYTTSDEIAEMFTTLLATASSKDTVADAHPAFITMIDTMVPDEARIIQYIGESNFILYCEVNYICKRKKMEDLSSIDLSTSFVTVRKWVTNIPSNVQLDFPENYNLYLTNLMSLGIIVDKRGYSKTNLGERYEEIIAMNKLRDLEYAMDKDKYEELQIENSFFEVTDLGKRFIKACCKK